MTFEKFNTAMVNCVAIYIYKITTGTDFSLKRCSHCNMYIR